MKNSKANTSNKPVNAHLDRLMDAQQDRTTSKPQITVLPNSTVRKPLMRTPAEVRTQMHWLAISRKKKTCESFVSRAAAVDHLVKQYQLNLQPSLMQRLENSLVAKVPYEGIVEVVSCDCTDGQHAEEVR